MKRVQVGLIVACMAAVVACSDEAVSTVPKLTATGTSGGTDASVSVDANADAGATTGPDAAPNDAATGLGDDAATGTDAVDAGAGALDANAGSPDAGAGQDTNGEATDAGTGLSDSVADASPLTDAPVLDSGLDIGFDSGTEIGRAHV